MAWYGENLYPDVAQTFELRAEILRARTAYQSLLIVDTVRFGRMLVLDDIVQTTEADEAAYHEMMVHPALFAHGAPRRVLVIGGGDGGIIRQVLKHRSVERCVMVEIDGEVVQACRDHLPAVSRGAFDDPRLELIIGDGAKFVAEAAESFDVVVTDSGDPIGPAEVLFDSPFYAACRDRLDPDGILVTQNGVPFLQPEETTSTWRKLGRLFAHRGFHLSPVPTYYGGHMAFAWGAAHDLYAQDWEAVAQRIAAAALDLEHYNAEIHRAVYAHPAWFKRLLRN
ncbi:polyamine aminopropyltransferase [Desertibaculum subflavum]|uniref:polyamine aminopropyltransferase n=1 Tax=Desertibaculum subflavum TaxID=2268458 RepID=UPI000E670C4F